MFRIANKLDNKDIHAWEVKACRPNLQARNRTQQNIKFERILHSHIQPRTTGSGQHFLAFPKMIGHFHPIVDFGQGVGDLPM